MLRLLLAALVAAHAYDPTELPKAYTEGIGAFQAPGAAPPEPPPPPEPTPLEHLMRSDTPEPELQSEVLKSLLTEEQSVNAAVPERSDAEQEDWSTHGKFLEQQEKDRKREERRRRRWKRRHGN